MTSISCCAECGEKEGSVTLKACKSCWLVKYCNAKCQKNHWLRHKKICKQRAAELHDEALFKDPPSKEACPICSLPMPEYLISCISLPPATIMSVPIYDFAMAHEALTKFGMEQYYPCCGKSICNGCSHSFAMSGNNEKCPFCNFDRGSETEEEYVEQIMKRVQVNDAGAMCELANCYSQGAFGLQLNRAKVIALQKQAAELGSRDAHYNLGMHYSEGGDLKKAKFHFEISAMAGHEVSRCNLGAIESESGNMDRALKHWVIAASTGQCKAMDTLRRLFKLQLPTNPNVRITFKQDEMSRDTFEATLAAYNKSCAEMRSEARDSFIRALSEST